MDKETVSVYGYGRFGKLWVDILSQDFHVQVYSRHGIAPGETPKNTSVADHDKIFECSHLFFCISISSFEQVLKDNGHKIKPGTVVFDTCSVKVMPVSWMLNHVPDTCEIIATHPMFGPDSYYLTDSDKPIVMCSTRAKEETFCCWKSYFNGKPMRVVEMTPEEHDQKAAYSQGITHYVGRVLADLDLKPGEMDTLGYRKLLDIIEQTCHDDWQLFLDLQKFNPYTVTMRKELYQALQKIYQIFSP